jgi:hypothetical protein
MTPFILTTQFALVINLASLGVTFILWGLDKTGLLEKVREKGPKFYIGIMFILVGLFYFYLTYLVDTARFS